MPSAKVQLPNGSVITIEAETDELVRIAHLLTGNPASEPLPKPKRDAPKRAKLGRGKPKGLTDHVRSLKADGFFKPGRTLDDVREALTAAGYIHSPNEISPVLLRLRR